MTYENYTMNLARLNSFNTDFFNSDASHSLLRFQERRKCLNAIFWMTYEKLSNGHKTVLVIDQDNDLEYINYFLSKYKLDDLSIILDKPTELVSLFIIERFKESRKNQTKISTYLEAKENLDYLNQQLIENIKNYNDPSLGKLNLFDVFLRIENVQAPILPIDLFQLFPFDEYKNKKNLILQADKLYRRDFRYDHHFDLFRPQIFKEHTPESQLVVLNHLKDQINEILGKYSELERRFYIAEESKIRESQLLIRKKIMKLDQLIQTSLRDNNSTATQKVKNLYNELKQILNLEQNDECDINAWEAFKNALDIHLKKELSLIYNSMPIKLKQINLHSGESDLEQLFQKTEEILKELKRTSIFKNYKVPFCSSVYHHKESLLDAKSILEAAIYALVYKTEHLEWCLFYSQLEQKDQLLIKTLIEIESDWMECFEASYLQSYASNALLSLSSLSEMHKDILDAYVELEDKSCALLFDRYKTKLTNLSIEKISEEAKKGLQWMDLYNSYGEAFSNTFPFLIINSSFYNTHKKEIGEHYKTVISLNTIISNLNDSTSENMIFAGYNDGFLKNSVSQIKSLEDIEVYNFSGVEFNVNRSAQFLSSSELVNLSLYLAQGINYFNTSYRIFQLRNTSILSLLTNEQNSKLIMYLKDTGIKEIFTNDENQNLIPALFGDKQRKTMVLVEDYLLNPKEPSQALKQKLFIEKLQVAGILIINLDNYKRLTKKSDEMKLVVKKVLEHEPNEQIIA